MASPGIAVSTKRNCPVCGADKPEVIDRIVFSGGEVEEVSVCGSCGMGYANDTPTANYDVDSKYSVVESIGSGESAAERRRMDRIVADIRDSVSIFSFTAILDIGCARGGLLEAFSRAGFDNVMGMDPSADCVAAVRKRGLEAIQGTIEDESQGVYDLVTLSHVLEHVWDVPKALDGVRQRLVPNGYVYVEVPNAARYLEFIKIPFLDFNREHISHFSLPHLADCLGKNGFVPMYCGEKTIETPHGEYPACWILARMSSGKSVRNESWLPPLSLAETLTAYAEKSQEMMYALDAKLLKKVQNRWDIILWGFGEFAQRLLHTSSLKLSNIVQVIDHDPRKHGKRLGKLVVEPPRNVVGRYPIVVASVVNQESILRDIRKMGIKNEVITVSL